MRRRRTALAAGTLAVAATFAAGCSQVSVEQLPLPGGANLGSHPYEVNVQFEDVINLVPQASVRVNDVPVGRVKKISLPRGSWHAQATLIVNGDVHLPANATANLEQSSLLGEKYIKLAAPPVNASAEPLTDGATIPLARTTRNADTEEVFGALSMLLSGGGLPQIRTINQELNSALNGREDKVRSALENLNKLTSTLDKNRTAITDALDGMNRLSSTVAARDGQVSTVLTDLSPGLKVMEQQRGQLVDMLRKLDDLSDVAVKVINKSEANTAADLRSLSTVLDKLADSGRDLPKSLEVLLTYPFTDEATKAIKGDYLNGYLTVVADPNMNCVIPASVTKADDVPKMSARALAADNPNDPQEPLPTPCPDSDPNTGKATDVNSAATTPSTPGLPTTPSTPPGGRQGDAPALPLPTLGGGN
ncbi:MCE family protein [Actinomadura atramentaria]|uniref:MCE family protein n=1 Tax=Actinomadura atramentaria TaxID=1990 RepID=UPI00039F00C1|nr:MCE family protein [Actinomadura atramentaria]